MVIADAAVVVTVSIGPAAPICSMVVTDSVRAVDVMVLDESGSVS